MIRALVTIGPISLNTSSIIHFGKKTNLFRLNGSHSDLKWHKNAITQIRSAYPNAFILMDIPGIKPRTSNTSELSIKKGEVIAFGEPTDEIEFRHVGLTKSLPNFGKQLSTFSLNDGQFIFDVVDTGKGVVVGKSRESFNLLPKKGINLPGSIYDDNKQLSIYSEFIEQIRDFNVDALGISFIQTSAVINELKQRFPEFICVSKIENSAGWKNAQDIIEASDAIMIDRGDLAAEVGFANLYKAVTEISFATKTNGKPLIMATENLESMIDRESPSKSEVMSLGHSIDIGSDCIMLSEETALSNNGKVIVDWLDNFLTCNTRSFNMSSGLNISKTTNPIWRATTAFSDLSYVILSKSGYALWQFFSQMPDTDLTLITENLKLRKLIQLYRAKITVLDPIHAQSTTPSDTMWNTIRTHKKLIFETSNDVAAICVSKYVKHSRANSITIYSHDDFE